MLGVASGINIISNESLVCMVIKQLDWIHDILYFCFLFSLCAIIKTEFIGALDHPTTN